MAKWFYGFFETYPARFTFHEAKVLIDGVWLKFNAAEVASSATVVDSDDDGERK
jgi:hypothetical protein